VTARPPSRVRFERRAAAARRRPWLLWGAVAAVLAILAGVGWVLLASPLTAVSEVTVEGVEGADRDAVRTAAAAPMDIPLARVDTGSIGTRVAALPFVRSVGVSRGWPHTLVVTVTPRVAILAVRADDGSLELVDDEAVSFRSVTTAPAGVVLVNRGSAAPAREGLLAVVAVLRVLPEAERARLKDITVTSASLVTFTLGGVQVVWGGPGQEDKKLRVLQILLAKSPPTTTVIDVSAPDTPVTR
jgi:cell division protein FtsQ